MIKDLLKYFLILAYGVLGSGAMAQEQAEGSAPFGMPGPPPQMKEVAYLVGEWDVDMKMKMSDTATEFTPTKGTCRYESILDGSALQMTYEGEMMGMMFKGFGLQCFNRETNKWQMTWSDNIGACISFYEGEKKDGVLSVSGIDRYQGMEFLTRISSFNETPTRFEWKMEMSMDGGKTFVTNATAVYTKKK